MEFLDLSHQLRYQVAMAIKTNSFKIDNLTYIETKDPNVDFVIAEDKGRTFVLKVDKDCPKLTKDIRKCLGFDYFYNEPFEFTSGISIAAFDVIIKILKTFHDEKEIKDYILNEEIKQFEGKDYVILSNYMSFQNPYEEFVDRIKDKDVEEIKMLSKNYMEIRSIIDRSFDNNPELDELYRNIETRFIELARKYGVELTYQDSRRLYDEETVSEDEEHVEEEIKAPINVNDLLAKIRMKKVLERKDEFYDFLSARKGEINLWNGEIKAFGILLDKFGDNTATILVLNDQEIQIDRNGAIVRIPVKPSLLLVKKNQENFQLAR